MKFNKYPSIENSYRVKFIDKIRLEGLADGVWIVEEKIHGSNFSIWYDKETEELKFCKRSGPIQDGENFFNYQKLVPELTEKTKKLANLVQMKRFVIFGELFGGVYPHPDVKGVNTSAVQKGIYYHPDLKFMAYDIYGIEESTFLNSISRELVLQQATFDCIPHLFTGSFEECLKYSNSFQTLVPEYYGLPAIDGNICEGVVIKPVRAKYLKSDERVIIKNKNEKFAEVSKSKKPTLQKTSDPLPENLEIFYHKHSQYCTESRFLAVTSKIGEVSIKDFKTVLTALRDDIMKDFVKDVPEFNDLDGKDKKRLDRLFGNDVMVLTRESLMKVEKGEL